MKHFSICLWSMHVACLQGHRRACLASADNAQVFSQVLCPHTVPPPHLKAHKVAGVSWGQTGRLVRQLARPEGYTLLKAQRVPLGPSAQ